MARTLRIRRVLGRTLVVAALLLAVGLLLDLPGVRGLVDRRLEDVAEVVTGEPVRIEDVRLHLWPPALTIVGLELGEPDQPRVRADSVYAQPGLRGWRPVLAVLTLDRPQVHLVLDEDGLRGFTALRQGEATLSELPWDELAVRSGLLVVELPSADITLRLEGLDVRPDLVAGRADLLVDALAVRVGEDWQRSAAARVLGVTLGPGEVVVPRIDLDFPVVDLWGSLSKDLDGKGFANVQLDIDLEAFGHLLDGPWRPSGRIRVDLESDGPAAEGTLLADLTLLDEESDDLYDFQEVTAAFDVGPGGVVLQPLRWSWAEGEVLVDGILTLEGGVEALRVQAEGIDFARVMQLTAVSEAPWVDFVGDADLALSGSLVPLELGGSFSAALQGLRVGAEPMEARGATPLIDVPRGWLAGELSLDAEGVGLEAEQVVLGRTRGTADATIGFASHGPLAVAADLVVDLRDLAPLGGVELEGRGPLVGTLEGPFEALQASGRADLTGFRLYDIPLADTLEVADLAIDLGLWDPVLHLGKLTARTGTSGLRGDLDLVFADELGLETELLVEHGSVADFVGWFTELPGLDGEVAGSVTLSGPPEALDGEVDLLFGEVDLFGESFEGGQGHARLEAGSLVLDEAWLHRADETERLTGHGTVAHGGAMDITVEGRGFALERSGWLQETGQPFTGVLDLDVVLGGQLDDWAPRGEVTVRDTWAGQGPLGDSILSFETEDGLVAFEGDLLGDAVWGRGTLEVAAPHVLHLDGGLADLPLDVFTPMAADGRAIEARASGGLVLDGALQGPEVSGELVLDQVWLAWGEHRVENTAAWVLGLDGDALSFDDVRLAGGATWLELRGGKPAGEELRVTVGGQADLAWVGAVIPGVVRSEGTARVGLRVGGGATRVEASGQWDALAADWFPHPFEAVAFTGSGTADGYVVESVEGELGGGRLEGQGRLEAEGWIPTQHALEATLDSARLQVIEELPPAVGDATLTLTGPPEALLLSGDVVIEDIRFTERIDWEGWLLESSDGLLVEMDEPLSGSPLFSWDLSVTADGTIHVRNNVGEGTCDADLTILGDSERVGMTGWVRMRPGGEMTLQNRPFEVERAELRYVDAFDFDPELDFELTTRIRSGDTEYDISYRVGGLYSDWSTTASSEPSLPMADINALLLFGMTREQVERSGGLNTALLIEGLDLVTGVRQGRAEAMLQSGRLDVLPDRLDLVTGMSPRGDSVSSDWRLLAEKELGEWTLTGDVNLADWDQRYWSLQRDLGGAVYLTVYRASQEEAAGLAVDGAWGADFIWRWELQ